MDCGRGKGAAYGLTGCGRYAKPGGTNGAEPGLRPGRTDGKNEDGGGGGGSGGTEEPVTGIGSPGTISERCVGGSSVKRVVAEGAVGSGAGSAREESRSSSALMVFCISRRSVFQRMVSFTIFRYLCSSSRYSCSRDEGPDSAEGDGEGRGDNAGGRVSGGGEGKREKTRGAGEASAERGDDGGDGGGEDPAEETAGTGADGNGGGAAGNAGEQERRRLRPVGRGKTGELGAERTREEEREREGGR